MSTPPTGPGKVKDSVTARFKTKLGGIFAASTHLYLEAMRAAAVEIEEATTKEATRIIEEAALIKEAAARELGEALR